ncbi:hypothetical protein TRFO_03300 [Tritrichomonas foetus]|uniref:SGF29 C-terminal domain-containing protein n=1 Tax=Tritrichomonas foetus TaxID=1144522 RepID=A0A1J4KR25_9EUKA|nr:hypothetical protein TRFO_03300 [Tritrichomonas foetus]|eukprot:OHT13554.1 hypothetical protein TRFO_03300 [Tritrichomonas foetus]
MNNQNEFIQKLNLLKVSIDQLDSDIKSIAAHELHFQPNKNDYQTKHVVEEIRKINTLIMKQYDISVNSAKDLSQCVDHMLSETKKEKPVAQEHQFPTKDEVSAMMQDFFKSKIKTRLSPIPMYCGCYAFRNKTPKEGHFVCAHIDGNFILMIVSHFEDGICSVFDPTDFDSEIKIIKLKNDEWTPLPTIIPERPIKRWEHAKDSTVLSLWPNQDGTWTTAFYKATVKLQPCDRADNEDRGYELDFGDNMVHVVPEKFIVTFPEGWQN